MTSVFIAGSRAISRLNSQVSERLENIVRQNLTVLVGDAKGADKAVQRFFASRNYRNVVVHCMDSCRNNVGGWPIRHHTAPPETRRDRHFYAIKDRAMAEEATCGFMLWDGKSKGTLANVLKLLDGQKKVVLYVRLNKSFFTLAEFDDLRRSLEALGVRDVPQFLVSLGVTSPRALPLIRFG